MSDEVDFENAKAIIPQKTVEFFGGKLPNPEDIDALKEPHENLGTLLKAEDFGRLQFKDLCEAQAAQFYLADEQEKAWKKIRQSLRDETEELAKERRGNLAFGAYILEIEKAKGATKIEWELVAKEHMSEKDYKQLLRDKELVKEGKLTHKWITKAEDGIKIGVDKTEKSE